MRLRVGVGACVWVAITSCGTATPGAGAGIDASASGGTAGASGANGTDGSSGRGGAAGAADSSDLDSRAGAGGASGTDVGTDGSNDASLDGAIDDGASDATDDSRPTCNVNKPFLSPTPVASINSGYAEDQIYLTPDGLTAVFSSSRPAALGGYNLYTATRTSPTGDFGPATLLANVNSEFNDREPVLSADGLTLFFASDRVPPPSDGGNLDIYVAKRSNTLSDFTVPGPVTGVNSDAREDPNSLSPDGQTLYFDSTRATGNFATYMKSLVTSDPPTPLSEPNTPADTSAFVVTRDSLVAYFASALSASPDSGANEVNIWVGHRTTPTGPLLGVARVDELNTSSLDIPNWIAPDGCTLYFVTDRNNASLSYDIWVARKPEN